MPRCAAPGSTRPGSSETLVCEKQPLLSGTANRCQRLCAQTSVGEHEAMMASMEADNVSTSASPLSVNPSRIRLCWRARAAMIASAYTYRDVRIVSHIPYSLSGKVRSAALADLMGVRRDTRSRTEITALSLPYVTAIQPHTTVWLPGQGPLPPKP